MRKFFSLLFLCLAVLNSSLNAFDNDDGYEIKYTLRLLGIMYDPFVDKGFVSLGVLFHYYLNWMMKMQ